MAKDRRQLADRSGEEVKCEELAGIATVLILLVGWSFFYGLRYTLFSQAATIVRRVTPSASRAPRNRPSTLR